MNLFTKLDITKKIDSTNFAGVFVIVAIRSYDTNILEKMNINNLILVQTHQSEFGFKNDYEFIIKNVNSDTKNSDINSKFYLSGLFQYNSSLPMVKKVTNLQIY